MKYEILSVRINKPNNKLIGKEGGSLVGITERNFIFQLKKKNEKALEYVIAQYGGLIKAIVRKHLYNLESYQEDCINDILLGVWNNIDSFDSNKNTFKNWLAGVSKYKSIDYKRKYLKDLEQESLTDTHFEVKAQDNALQELIKNQLSEEMEDLLSCLKSEDRELFLKLYVEEKEIDWVSKETGLKKEIIYNRISRGKRKLQKNIVERGL